MKAVFKILKQNPQIVSFGLESQPYRNQPMVSNGMSKTICKSEKVLH